MRIEVSPSGRASCRGCKTAIPKGELRFGETYTIPGTEQEATRYWHMKCAAEKIGGSFLPILTAYEGEVADRAALEEAAKKGGSKKGGTKKYPHADKAPTGRAKCIQCSEAIAKGEWRVVVEREIDTGSFMQKGAGYLHPACALGWQGENDEGDPGEFVEAVIANMDGNDADKADLRGKLESEG